MTDEHESPLQLPSDLELEARRRILGLGYDPTAIDHAELNCLIAATVLLGLPSPPLLATLAIVRNDPPRLWRDGDPRLRCIVCHWPISPRRIWLIDGKHPVHRRCRPLPVDEGDAG